MDIMVKKRNGRLEKLNVDKINKVVQRCSKGLENVSASEVVIDAHIQLYDKITTDQIDFALILTARSKTYKDPEYALLAARLLLNSLYKEVFGEGVDCDAFELQYKKAFISNIKKMVKNGILSEKMLDFDLKKISESIIPSRDFIFRYHGIQNIYDRYLLRMDDVVMETPQAYYMRVAMGLSIEEKNKEDRAIEFYNVYSQHLGSPSTPTLFNSGTVRNQLSSCYLSEISDSIDGIFDGLWQEALKSKHAGGLGFHFSKIRGTNSYIKGTNGKSSGLIPWTKIYNDMLVAVNQGGKRNGSGCAYLSPWHIDVEEFIDLRKETGEERRRTHDMNTALWCPDIFFNRIREEGEWTLFCPNDFPELTELFGKDFEERYIELENKSKQGLIKNSKTLKAKDLWKKILRSYFETSHPWITHSDNWNIRYQNCQEGILHGSNLCTEIGITTKSSTYKNGEKIEIGKTGVCTLSSVNLSAHIENGKINNLKLENTIKSLIRALDNVININYLPTKEAGNSSLNSRDIGLGTMGWADVYHKLDIIQDSEEGVIFADELMEFISYCAISSSNELAKERGVYNNYNGSNWNKGILPIDTYKNLMKFKGKRVDINEKLDWKLLRESILENGMRNAQVMAIAPNASIAYQLGVEQSIEPNYSVLFSYENKSGTYYIINEHFVNDMKKEKIWNHEFSEKVKSVLGDVLQLNIPEKYKNKYKKAFDRDQMKLVEACAARQKWIDQGISFNGYQGGTSLKFLNDYYLYSNELGLKSNYYLRVPPASNAQQTTNEIKPEEKVLKTEEDYKKHFEVAKQKALAGEPCESCQG